MTYLKFLAFMKNFNLFNQIITKESLAIIYAKRCPNKTIDFAAFVDILFKISKKQIKTQDCHSNSTRGFQIYLERYVLRDHLEILEQQTQIRTPRLNEFNDGEGSEKFALNLLLENDNLLNHVSFI